ncbi:MAG: exonuclease SbcCD subunit D [Clostridiales bacterium]|nr:exonuclease SbcCD subunit D [Clostridiales bacterium]
MKFLHTSDLHLGKTVNGFSMLEDQKFMLQQLLGIAKAEEVDAVVIAGDVYDRSIPPAEAVTLLDAFLEKLAEAEIPVLMISGNHDSPERLSFGSGLLQRSGIYIQGEVEEPVRQVTLTDDLGPVHFFLLPFFKPAIVSEKNSEGAVGRVLAGQTAAQGVPDKGASKEGERTVLVTHFFVTAGGKSPELSEAETGVDVGGIDNVDVSWFADFEYTALGHIHKAQRIGEGAVYYSGAPLAYSFSEAGAEKSVNLVTLREKGCVTVEKRILHPLRRMRILNGTLSQLSDHMGLTEEEREDYIQARLTDKEELIDPIGTLRSVYPNIMQIVFADREERGDEGYALQTGHRQMSTQELFGQFYEIVREEKLDEEGEKLIDEIVRELKKEEVE